MRRRSVLLLIPLLLLTLASPALASDYRETAVAYLKGKYDVPDDQIQLYEGGVVQLELTGESFWCAKYTIGPLGESTTDKGDAGTKPNSRETKPLPQGAEPLPTPAPDTGTRILPVPPDGVIEDDSIYGGLYIRIKTGEVLEMDEAESYFAAEQALVEREWERLRLEAGKLDVPLYVRLNEVPATETVTVWIHPAPVVTDSIRARFAALKEKYPKIAEGAELMDVISCARAYIMPAVGRTGVAPEGAGGAPDAGVITAVGGSSPGDPVKEPPPPGKPEPAPMPDDEYWREYSEFWQEIEQIRTQTVAPSLTAIKAALDDKGIAYREEGTAIVADLTGGQIRVLAELPSVETIMEYMIYTVMDAGGEEPGSTRGSATTGQPEPPVTKNAKGESATAASPTVYVTAVLLIGGLMAIGLRTIQARRK